MSAPKITAEKAIALVGVLPSLHPRPNGTNLNKLERGLVEKLSSVASYQSTDEGYGGMVEDPTIFALRCKKPWVAWPDPGPHRVVDPALNTAGQADALVQYNFKMGVYESNENVKAAVIGGLNLAVPSAYRKVAGGGVGTRMYRTTDDPREIIKQLRRLYGQLSPTERETMDNKWSAPWNTALPIEHYFKGLEEMFILATKYPPEFTMGQMVGKAKTAMEKCGLFQSHLNEWSQFTPPNQDWTNMKQHFGEAYENLLISGRGVGVPGTIANAQELEDEEDDSINTITDVMSNVMGTMQMASNANAQSMNEGMTAMRQEMATLRAEVQASRQALANNAMWGQPPPAQPAPQPVPQWTPPMTPSPNMWPPQPTPPPAAAYAAIPPPGPAGAPPGFPNFLGPPFPPQQRQPGGRGGGGGRGRGRQGGGRGGGRGGRASTRSLAFARQPPTTAAAMGAPNPNKYYNNWNMCFSCGFDVPGWHTSQTCPAPCRREHHHEGCDRTNYTQYKAQGYTINMKRANKSLLPSNPGPHQA